MGGLPPRVPCGSMPVPRRRSEPALVAGAARRLDAVAGAELAAGWLDQPAVDQQPPERRHALLDALAVRRQPQRRRSRRLVERVDARDVVDLAGAGAAVEVVVVARLADLERGVAEDLEEAVLADDAPRQLA